MASVRESRNMGKEAVYRDKRALIDALVPTNASVCDVGFGGQAVTREEREWPHALLQSRTKDLYGVDRIFDASMETYPERYQQASAENFKFNKTFDIIFSSELIEHLTNPGLFLECVREHLSPDGRLILTTPNAFSLFPILEKWVRDEPSVNSGHTMYFNKVVLAKLLECCGFEVLEIGYVDSFRPSGGLRMIVRRLLDVLSLFTNKFHETLVVVARPHTKV